MRPALFITCMLLLSITACKNDTSKDKTSANKLSADSLLSEALVLQDSGLFEQAISKHTAALAIEPNNILCLNNRGWDYYELGENAKAMADFDKLLKIDTLSTAGMYGKAVLLYENGEYETALALLYEIIRIQGDLDMEKQEQRAMPIINAPLDRVYEMKDSSEFYLGIAPVPDEVLVPYKDEYYNIEPAE